MAFGLVCRDNRKYVNTHQRSERRLSAMTTDRNCGTCVKVDPETGQPECQALETLDQVLTWEPAHDLLLDRPFSHTASFKRYLGPWTRPCTLVCHDFKGGYLEDRYLQGGQKVDPYYFCRWECIDIFVYFSHHFVTVPPLGWIRAAHKHGVMILGTLITEWDDGAAIWSRVLSSKDTMKRLASQLVSISAHYGFDGWLVNVENKIDAETVAHLREFVEMLTQESHDRLPGSRVLWYDSVTRDGELKWQDQLNEENSMFFDASDGIFLNYCWTPEKLAASKYMAEEKGRPFDVFVGIDVFGRGCPGGGGFNTREALQHAKEKNLSAAIFAPGWVLETLGLEEFDENDCRFWSKVHDLCPLTSGDLPLATAFCQGHGNSFFCLGQNVTGKPWFNMSMQQRQPERTRVYGFEDPQASRAQASLNTCLSSAYFGGCSVQLSAHLTQALHTVTFRLFSLRAELDDTLYCSYTYKNSGNASCEVFLVLTFGSGMLTHQAVMGPKDKEDMAGFQNGISSSTADGQSSEPVAKRPRYSEKDVYVSPLTSRELEPLKSCLWFHDLQENGREGDSDGWTTRHFRLDTTKLTPPDRKGAKESVSVAVSLSRPVNSTSSAEEKPSGEEGSADGQNGSEEEEASILLGHLQIFREKDLQIQSPEVVNITLEKFDPLGLNTLTNSSDQPDPSSNTSPCFYIIHWDVEGSDTSIDYFNIYLGEGESMSLVGHSPTAGFVTNISAEFVVDGKVSVTIQPVLTATSLPQVLSKCPSKTFSLAEFGSS